MGIDTFRWLVNEAALHDLLVLLSMPLLLFIVALCIAVLSFGADWMIEGVVGLAIRTGFPTIVIGATIISLGTTMPEAFVSVMAAYMGNPGLALGNGVGSIIADTGLIFGLTCVLATLPVNKFILNRTGWIQIGSAVLLVLLSLLALAVATEGSLPKLQRWMGFFLLGLLLCYLYLTYFCCLLYTSDAADEYLTV